MPPHAPASTLPDDKISVLASSVPAKLSPRLWYVHGKAYDFAPFVRNHPGGEKAILLGQGRDCTELFESYHTYLPSDKILDKYQVADTEKFALAKADSNDLQLAPETVVFTFKENGFYRTLKGRVADYFKKNKLSTKAPLTQKLVGVLNIIAMAVFAYLGFYKGIYVFAALQGLCRAMIIVRDTHAASHYAWSENPTANQWMYRIAMAFAGTSPSQWTSKHVIAHHIDTNITPVDDDTMWPIKRVLPDLPRYPYHAFQHIYIWVFYCFTLLMWTTSDIIKLAVGSHYEGTTKILHFSTADWIETYGSYVFHVSYRFVLPFVALPFNQALIVFLLGEVTASLAFVTQFVVNHEVEVAVQSVSENRDKQKSIHDLDGRDWGVHQVQTSHDYAVPSTFWLNSSGGLNLQIEHHLFPSVHFSHYTALQSITQETCKEFGIQYNTSPTLLAALIAHADHLRKMGQAA